jgi:hypothetical protein
MKQFIIIVIFSALYNHSYSIEVKKRLKDSTKVEISLVFATDDMYRGKINKKNHSVLFTDYYFKQWGMKAIFTDDSIYSIIKKKLVLKPPTKKVDFLCYARIILLKKNIRDTIFMSFIPRSMLYFNGKLYKTPAGISSFLYHILLDKYNRKEVILIGSEVNEVNFKVMNEMIFDWDNK